MSVVSFLDGSKVDNNERTFDFVMQQDDDWFESEHNYIQWLFPLLEESYNVYEAPVLDLTEVTLIRNNQVALENQIKALGRMVVFYKKNDLWLVPMDHNHLRITRILKSIRLLHSLPVAESFYDLIMERVKETGSQVEPRNIAFWTDAVGLSYNH